MNHPTIDTQKGDCCPISSRFWLPCSQSKEQAKLATETPAGMEKTTLKNGWNISWTLAIKQSLATWEQLEQTNNLYLSTAYLDMLEGLDLQGVTNGIVVFDGPNKERFGMIVQQFSFSAKEQLGHMQEPEKSWRKRAKTNIKKGFGKLIETNILTAGQMHLTGQHGLRTRNENKIREEWLPTIIEGLDAVAAKWPIRIHGLMLKDMDLQEEPTKHGFHILPVQPNMVLHLKPNWQSFDDYLDAMTAKYRTRARRARKKSKGLSRREFTLEEIRHYQTELHGFYSDIANTSDYNAVTLPENYFTEWKNKFGEYFKLWGYFLEEELVGFSTAIFNTPNEMEAHFLGFRQELNRSHQLYLNMLYDLVNESIESQVKHLVLARTALEIKSSVGAVPEELRCWFRSRIKIVNPLVPVFAPMVSPLPEWIQRNPFKEEQ